MSSSQQTKTSSSTTDPWSGQSQYLLDAFNKAQSNYNSGSSNVYNGNQVAQYNDDQRNTATNQVNYGNNTSTSSLTNAGNTLASAGTNGVTNALNTLANYRPSTSTASNISAAGQYANNPYLSGQVSAAMTDAMNTANEGTMPQIQRNAASTGNLNSNRTAIQQGIVQRGLQTDAANISSNLRGNAYSQGLNLAEQQGEHADNTNLAAAQYEGQLGNSAVNTGVNATTQGINDQRSLYDMASQGGATERSSDQASIDNSKSMNEYSTDRLNSLMNAYYSTVGGNNWGNSTSGTQTSTSSPSTMNIIGGLLGSTGSMFTGGGNSAWNGFSSLFNRGGS